MATPHRGAGFGRLRLLTSAIAIAGTLGYFTATASAQTVRGVTDTEIVIGTITDLSGVTAVQGVNNSDAVRMAFDEANAKGGVNGRKIKYIVEDNQYHGAARRAGDEQAAEQRQRLPDDRRRRHADERRQHADAVRQERAEHVPADRGALDVRAVQQAEIRAVRLVLRPDALRGEVFRREARAARRSASCIRTPISARTCWPASSRRPRRMGMKVVATTAHRPTDTDFNAPIDKLQDAGCDAIMMGTIVRDTNIIIQTARKMNWNVDLVGQFAAYDTAVATPARRCDRGLLLHDARRFTPIRTIRARRCRISPRRYKARFGRDPNFHGEVGYTAAQMVLLGAGERRQGPDGGQLHQGDGEHPRLQGHLRFRAVASDRTSTMARPSRS